MVEFTLSEVFATVARTVPDQEALVWRDRRLTYAATDTRIDGLAHFLVAQGLGCRRERSDLAPHESGQDHVGLYLRNGNEYVEAMVGATRARAVPFNVNYRYVADELAYLLGNAEASALVYHAEFASQVAAVRERLPRLTVLIQVADHSGNVLLPGAFDYEAVLATPPADLPAPRGDDLFLVYTGGTTGLPKGVMWRQHDLYVSSMGGTLYGTSDAFGSYEDLATHARNSAGGMRMLMVLPLMHAAAQWSAFHMFTGGGTVVIPDGVIALDARDALAVAAREHVHSIPVVGDSVVLPLVEEVERAAAAGKPYDLTTLAAMNNGSAPLSPVVRERALAALPHILLMDSVGSSETGIQMGSLTMKDDGSEAGVFTAMDDTAVLSPDLTRVLGPGEGDGWLARRRRVPLGYLGDPAKTARTFPVIDGVRWSVPGDRADVLEDGRIRLRGRDSVTINTGGEKVFAEEVEQALVAHPAVRDAVVVGRPSPRWGSEVVAVVQLQDGETATPAAILEVAARTLARYKLPKDVVFVERIQRSPVGKADYRWARSAVT